MQRPGPVYKGLVTEMPGIPGPGIVADTWKKKENENNKGGPAQMREGPSRQKETLVLNEPRERRK